MSYTSPRSPDSSSARNAYDNDRRQFDRKRKSVSQVAKEFAAGAALTPPVDRSPRNERTFDEN